MKWNDYPLLRLAASLTLGIVAAEHSVPHISSMMLFVVGCVVLAFMTFILVRTSCASVADKKGTYAFGLSAMLLSFIFGMFLYVARYERMAGCVGENARQYEGIVKGMPKEKRKSWMVRLADAKRYDVILYIGKDSAHLDEQRQLFASVQEGDTIRADARKVRSVASSDTAYISYRRWLLHSGVCATAYVPKGAFSLSRYDGHFAWRGANARAIQRKLHELYEDNGIEGEAGDVIEAMSIGWRNGMSESVRRSYSRAGASHMLALSGFHVGIIMMVIQCMLMVPIVRRQKARVLNVLAVAVLWSFVIVAGASASLVRAAVMCTLAIVAALFNRSCKLINVCLFAYVLMLCANPMSLFDVGFQFSFLSVAGIGAYSELTRGRISPMPVLLRVLSESVAISLVCSVLTAPMVAHHFGCVSLVSVVSNLAALFMLYGIVLGTFMWWLTLCCSPVNDVVTTALSWVASTLNETMDSISSLPFAAVEWRPGTLATLCCYAVLLAILYVARSIMREKIKSEDRFKKKYNKKD